MKLVLGILCILYLLAGVGAMNAGASIEGMICFLIVVLCVGFIGVIDAIEELGGKR